MHNPATVQAAFDRVADNRGANLPGVTACGLPMSRRTSGYPGCWTTCGAALKDGSFTPLPVGERASQRPRRASAHISESIDFMGFRIQWRR